MFVRIPELLKPLEIATITNYLYQNEFVDGKSTASHQAKKVKNNLQLGQQAQNRETIELLVFQALQKQELVQSFAAPKHFFSLLFSKYEAGMYYGDHIDNAVMYAGGQPFRTDLSLTIFLNSPDDYDGGELAIESISETVKIKFACGDAVIYPASTIHRVEPVTRGVRLVVVAWIQSFIRDSFQRQLLYELKLVSDSINTSLPESRESLVLAKSYANLIRMWAEV